MTDDEWLEDQLAPELVGHYGHILPALPDDDTQISFTGMCGRPNLEQALSFYRYARNAASLATIQNPAIMDFGAGWGRIARFFLRDVAKPGDITVCDTMPTAIRWLRETGAPFEIIQNAPYPPIAGLDRRYDLIYSYSVFSHLSEAYACAWLDFLIGRLKPNGALVFTTRGEQFIRDAATIHAIPEADDPPTVAAYLRDYRRAIPSSDILTAKRQAGEFQFYSLSHGELTEDCTGETIILRGYLEAHYPRNLAGFVEDVPLVDQAVVTFRAG